MNCFYRLIAAGWLALGFTSNLFAHGLPIDVLANSVTNRLFVIEGFEAGVLTLQPGVEISSTSPGLGVSFASNGIAASTPFHLEISQDLLYWDGSSVAVPTAELLVINPSFVSFYTVTESSGELTGLDWATYPGGSSWDAHGLYRLDSLAAPAGFYGLAARIAATGYESTKPFLLPLVYDPSSQWSAGEIADGMELLRNEIVVPAAADFDENGISDGVDFLSWQRGFGPVSLTTSPADGDADLDSDVDRYDLAFWKSEFGNGPPLLGASIVPEPKSILLAILGCLAACQIRFRVF